MSRGAEDDERLQDAIRRLQEGVGIEEASRHLFERYYPWVRRFFRRLGYRPEESEDLAQEIFSQVFRQIGSLRQDGAFKPWLFAMASNLHRNRRRDLHREKRRGEEVSIDARSESGTLLIEPRSAQASPERSVIEKQRREALSEAIRELPPQMGRALALRIEHGLKYREIAVVLRISVETVKAHLFSARQRLREMLGDEYGEGPDEPQE